MAPGQGAQWAAPSLPQLLFFASGKNPAFHCEHAKPMILCATSPTHHASLFSPASFLLLVKTTALVVLFFFAAVCARADTAPAAPQTLPQKHDAKICLKGKIYPDEHKTFTAPESGLTVIQLTSDPADDAQLYFTNDGFVPADHGLVFTSKRTGAWNLFYLKLDTYQIVQLTDAKKIDGISVAVSPTTMEAYYHEANAIKAVHLKTLVERVINLVPAGYTVSPLSVTATGKALAYSIQEDIPIASKTDTIYSDAAERFKKRPWCAVVTGHTDGTGWHEVIRQKKWFNHTLLNPLNENLILYCHEGPWAAVEQRMWLVDSGGRDNHMLRREFLATVQIGHEYWFRDGIHVGYMVIDPPSPKSIGIADVLDGSYSEYPTPFNDTHTQTNSTGDTFVGDGTEQEPYLNLYQLADGNLTGRHLWKHESSFTQHAWHPHPRFSPDDKFILLTSNRGGDGNLYLIKLDAAKTQPGNSGRKNRSDFK